MKQLIAYFRQRRLVREIGLAAIELHRSRREYLRSIGRYKVGDKPHPTYWDGRNIRADRHLSALTDRILSEEKS